MHIGFSKILGNKIFGPVVLFFLVTSAYGQTVAVQPIGVVKENGDHLLKMRVWNCASKDMEVPIADLPWGQYRLGLVLYPGGKLAGEPLKESSPVGDSPDTKVKIKAKSYADGEVDLDNRFHDIASYEKKENLLIFWEYDLSLLTGRDSQVVGGMVPLYEGSRAEDTSRTACAQVM